ncbi:MAG: OB-fold nucleic acid binding domain-containing protein [Candidatus Micrarchaeota archaeon]|nr:OB-fold nucleic acid binding domain-containing protein [Candidatus Micrarchaeota archaeon]
MLEFLKEPAKIRKTIIKEKKISEKELSEMVRNRQEQFNGLINETAALYSIAQELGVEVRVEKGELVFTNISELSPGMENVNLHVRVMGILAPRKFERNGKEGRVCNISVADETGEAKLVLWNKDVELVEKGVIEKGDIVDVLGGYVKEDIGEVQLPMGGQVLKVSQRKKLPEVASKLMKISEMQEGMNGVDFVAEILEVGVVNSFEKEGRMKQVSSMLIADESGKARLTLWDSNAELVDRAGSGDVIKVENAYAKKGLSGKELHADWRSRVILNPRNVKLPPVGGVVARVKIAELKEGMLAEVEGSIASAAARYDETCSKCKGILYDDSCVACGSKESSLKVVVNALLKDDSGEIWCVLSGRYGKNFLGVKEIPRDVRAESVLELKGSELIGKRIVMSGTARRNRNTGKLELSVSRVV